MDTGGEPGPGPGEGIGDPRDAGQRTGLPTMIAGATVGRRTMGAIDHPPDCTSSSMASPYAGVQETE